MHPIVTVISMGIASLVCTSTASLSTESQSNDDALAPEFGLEFFDVYE